MKPDEYKQLALRTEHTPNFVRIESPDVHGPGSDRDQVTARLIHAVLGMMSEVGEIADALKRYIIYGKDYDALNLIEEHGDESWYMNLFIDALGSSWGESWAKNIAKLRKRFGDKFSQEAALNRDLDAERTALEVTTPEQETTAELEQWKPVEDYIKSLKWTDTPEDVQILVAGNIRGFFGWLLRQREEQREKVAANSAQPAPAVAIDTAVFPAALDWTRAHQAMGDMEHAYNDACFTAPEDTAKVHGILGRIASGMNTIADALRLQPAGELAALRARVAELEGRISEYRDSITQPTRAVLGDRMGDE